MVQPVQTKPRRSPPPHLSREMGKLLAALASKSGAMDPRLAADWHEIAGGEIARLCRPVRLKSAGRARSLEVAVANGAAAMQLQYRQAELIERVNRVLGKGTVTRLLIRQTGAAGAKAQKGPSYSRPVMPPQEKALPAAPPSQGLQDALSRMRGLIAARDNARGDS